MATTSKAIAFRDDLASELKIRLAALAQAKTGDADLTIGAGTAGSDSAFIRITPVASLWKDIVGLPQTVFTPHVAQVVFEANPAGGAGADVGTWATRLAIIGCLVARGIKVEVYFSANTAAVSAAAITGAPSASFEAQVQYGFMGQ
jgi:hypothetical protein